MTEAKQDSAQLRALYSQIEEICRHFKEIRKEASGIVETSQMPDAALHLNDVLKATEEATITILDAASNTSALVDGSTMSEEHKKQVADQLGRIYEASSFQDLSGQRIKKVLRHLTDLETQLARLSETAKEQPAVSKPVDSYLNGPALAENAPSQSDIDAMFKQA